MFFSIYRDGQCQEHHADEQAICAVGLARAKPGIFVEAIQYILVLATPVEVRMLASYPFELQYTSMPKLQQFQVLLCCDLLYKV
jgi:hypothetical protein